MTYDEYVKGIKLCLDDLRDRKKTGKIEIVIDMNCGGIGKARIYVGQNIEDILREKKNNCISHR